MNWGLLKAAVVDYINRGDITPALMSRMLPIAEQRIFDGTSYTGQVVEGLRLMSMLTEIDPFTVGVLPADFLGAHRVARVSGGRVVQLQYLGPQNFAKLEGQASQSDFYTVRGSTLILAGLQSTQVELLYFARPVSPIADADTNAVMTRAQAVYLYSMLWEVANWLRDKDRAGQYASLFMDAMVSAQKADDSRVSDGGPLVITADLGVRV